MNIDQNWQKLLRNYLLDRLDEAKEELVELRLLEDDECFEELGIVSDELIDQYANGQVPAHELRQVERFVFELPERRQKLRFALALKRRAEERREQKRRRRRTLLIVPIAASLLIVGGLAAWRGLFSSPGVEKGLTALRAAYRDQRPVDARVTGFGYAPVVRGESRVDAVQRDLASGLLLSAATEHPDADSKHALAQYYITQQRFPEAVEQLEASLKLNSKNAKAESDLGLALFEQAKLKNGSGAGLTSFAAALDHFDRAIALDDSLLEAHYNRALWYQQMGLGRQAEEAWRKYLEKDSVSPWGNEARQHLRALEERRSQGSARNSSPPLDDFLEAYGNRDEATAWRILSQNREVVTRRFIPILLVDAYLDHAVARRTDEAAGMLDALAYAGELESRKSGDLYSANLARFYRTHSPNHLASLARANDLAAEGYELCGRSGFAAAMARFEEAGRIFRSLGNDAEAAFASYWLAWSSFYDKQTVSGRSYAEDVIRDCRERNYKWLLAQALGLLSNIKTGFYEQSAVLDLSRQALQLSEEVNDSYGTQKYLASLAGKYSLVYNFSESLDLLARCLLLANDFWPGDRQAWRNYDTATQVFNRMGHYAASAAFGEEAWRLVREGSKDPSLTYLSHVHLGMAYGRLKNYADGIKHAESGVAIGKSMPGNSGKEITAYSLFQLGELYRQRGDLEEAARRYNEAIGLYDQLAFQTFKFVAHRGLFLTYLAQGNDSGAAAELQVVLEIFDAYREKIKEEDNRNYFFDAAQEVYDAAIQFAHARLKNDEAAFEHSENSRARSLLATMLGASNSSGAGIAAKTNTAAEIRQHLPPEVQIVQYSVLSDKLLMWVISQDGVVLKENVVSREVLNDQVHKFLDLVSRPSSSQEDLRQASMALYDTLIDPIEAELADGKTLCIVPDKVLNHLPFAALISRASGRYLIQDHPLLFSPSSTVFLVNTQSAKAKPVPAHEKLFSVGNPSFDRQAFPSLPDLPAAAIEAQAIGRFYNPPAPSILTQHQARKEIVVSGMQTADVLHFASHYVVDDQSPMRSQLLLTAPGVRLDQPDANEAALSASDIYNMKLTRPRVAILSACRTGVERYYRGEGMIGMARTFLAAGVPVVVASQWPVDSAPTSGLMIRFHELRRECDLSTIEALRAAQLESLGDSSQSNRHPYYWAPFVTIGGYVTF